MPCIGNTIVSSLSLPNENVTNIVIFISGYLGATACVVLSNWGSAWGTWRAGLGVCNMGVNYPQGVIKNIVPIVMAGVLGI